MLRGGASCIICLTHMQSLLLAREGDEAVHPGLPDGLDERPFDAKVDGQQLAEFGEVLPEGSGCSGSEQPRCKRCAKPHVD